MHIKGVCTQVHRCRLSNRAGRKEMIFFRVCVARHGCHDALFGSHKRDMDKTQA